MWTCAKPHAAVQINKWYLDGRDAETGEYPAFPPEEVGGSKIILKPPAEPVEAPPEAPPPEKAAKGAKGAKAPPPGKKDAAAKPDGKGAKGKGDKAAQDDPGWPLPIMASTDKARVHDQMPSTI